MPPPQRRQPLGVIARLLAEPHRFGFFQAVRLLERWLGPQERGGAGAVLAKRLRFRNSLSLSFPASEIAEMTVVEAGTSPLERVSSAAKQPLDAVVDATLATADAEVATLNIERIEITPAFMGLLGSGGALPIYYTELLAERELYHRDKAARAFLDIFQQRAVALFYQSWRKHRLPVQYESDRRNHFLPLVLAVAGVGQRPLRDRLYGDRGGVADDTLAYFSGALQQRPASAAMVRQVLAEYFGVAVAIEQFIGRWFTLPPGNSTSLGLNNAELGTSALVGERVWQRDLRMRLVIGPMQRKQFRRFLPGGTAALALRELLSMLTGVNLEYEVRLSLLAGEVQGMALDEGDGGAGGALLGWDSFLVTSPERHDRSDAGYDIHALA